MKPPIQIRGLSFAYSGLSGSFRLGPVDLDLQPGELTFWIGANGSGKSTLARILAGELRRSKGEILGIEGQVGYHHQALDENVFPTLTVAEHLRLLARTDGAVLEALLVGFPELAESREAYPDQLSGGELQLLAFSGMVLQPRHVWIFDEVLNHLDGRTCRRVMEWIVRNLVTPESIVVVITHDLNIATSRADAISVFREGRVVEALKPKDEPVGAADLAALVTG